MMTWPTLGRHLAIQETPHRTWWQMGPLHHHHRPLQLPGPLQQAHPAPQSLSQPILLSTSFKTQLCYKPSQLAGQHPTRHWQAHQQQQAGQQALLPQGQGSRHQDLLRSSAQGHLAAVRRLFSTRHLARWTPMPWIRSPCTALP